METGRGTRQPDMDCQVWAAGDKILLTQSVTSSDLIDAVSVMGFSVVARLVGQSLSGTGTGLEIYWHL